MGGDGTDTYCKMTSPHFTSKKKGEFINSYFVVQGGNYLPQSLILGLPQRDWSIF